MKLKLREGLQDIEIYVPFENKNILGKFIPEGLYPYLYKISPDLFEVEKPKTIQKNDILINDTKLGGSGDTKGKIA